MKVQNANRTSVIKTASESLPPSQNPVSIIVDSGSDLLPDEASQLGIRMVPLKVRFGEEEFDDGVTISRDEFYNRMARSDVLPKTSQVSPFTYEEVFRQEVEAGRKVVCLTISSGMSGCYQSACIAAEEFKDQVYVIDTLQFCGPEYLLAQRAAEMRNQGLAAAEIAAAIENEKKQVRVIALFDTLRYLKMGGRISAAAAGIGNLLSIKPVMTIRDGKASIVGKARGSRDGNNHLIRLIEKFGGIDFQKPFLVSWSGNSDQLLNRYLADSKFLYQGISEDQIPRSRVGATIGTYTGPGAIAFSFFPLQR